VEVALATHTHPDTWLDTDDAMLATVLDVLAEQAERINRRGK
jgi:hypothetical protein